MTNFKVGEAKEYAGGISNPSKMPCESTNLDAKICNVGGKLRLVTGSVCNGCYALKGNYVKYAKNIDPAMARRLEAIRKPRWVEAMAVITGRNPYFRWHDSGDIQDMQHLIRIVAVAMLTPQTKHWIPTREYALVAKYKRLGGIIPQNLVLRQSAPMIDGMLPERVGLSSMVVTKPVPDVHLCPASQQGGKCLDCRACWDVTNLRIQYPKH